MIRVYTIENCPYCTELKEYLIKDKIEFIEIDVNKPENEPEFDKLFEVTKCYDVPMVKIGPQILIPETSFKSINECYELIKKLH
jgi:glutaredoxin